jgi:hypothetical protein
MKTRYRLIHRGRGHGSFYCVDSKTGKRTTLGKASISLKGAVLDDFEQRRSHGCSSGKILASHSLCGCVFLKWRYYWQSKALQYKFTLIAFAFKLSKEGNTL